MSVIENNPAEKINRLGIGRVITVLGSTLLMGAILFLVAGRLSWTEAWVLLGISLTGTLATALWNLRHNPQMLNERGRMGRNAKSWDKGIGLLYTLFLFAIYVLAGLDARFGWSAVPIWVKALGGIALALSFALTFWVMTVNTFLSTFVRIQEERGHTTVSSGPYRFVRHPMYVGILLMSCVMPFLLGSWWAVIPGGLNIVLFFIRTALEDRTLQAELPGYEEYVNQVHYRLIPGIW